MCRRDGEVQRQPDRVPDQDDGPIGHLRPPVVAGATISIDGSPPVPIKPETTSGSYSCVGAGLTLTFTGGDAGELIYTLVPAT